MTDERKPKHLVPIDCDRTDYERQFLRIACVGTNAEFSAAVAGIARRGNVRAIAHAVRSNSSLSTNDSGDQATDLMRNPISKARPQWNS
jgi:hypothetical protein